MLLRDNYPGPDKVVDAGHYVSLLELGCFEHIFRTSILSQLKLSPFCIKYSMYRDLTDSEASVRMKMSPYTLLYKHDHPYSMPPNL